MLVLKFQNSFFQFVAQNFGHFQSIIIIYKRVTFVCHNCVCINLFFLVLTSYFFFESRQRSNLKLATVVRVDASQDLIGNYAYQGYHYIKVGKILLLHIDSLNGRTYNDSMNKRKEFVQQERRKSQVKTNFLDRQKNRQAKILAQKL